MFKSSKMMGLLFSPDDVQVSAGNVTKDELIEILNDEPEEETIPLESSKKKSEKKEEIKEEEDKEDKEVEDEEIDELDELEEEFEEPSEEKLELGIHHSRREILSKYPKLFKDFPGIEKAIYREQAFTEVFPTVNDAKDAYEKASVLNKFEEDLIKGNTENVLKSVKEEDPNAFNKIVDNYLPTLAKIDNNAYLHVVGGIVQHTIMSLAKAAEGASEEDGKTLLATARILNQFVFGTTDFKPLGKLSTDKPNEKEEVNNERQTFQQERFNEVRNDLGNRVSNSLKATISKHIDPNDSMSEFVKQAAIRECMESIGKIIESDKRFKQILDKAWEYAAKNNFNAESVNKIKSAYFSRAKADLPTVIKKVRNNALKGLARGKKEDIEIDTEAEEARLPERTRKSKDTERSTSSNRGSNKIPHNVRTIDFLNS